MVYILVAVIERSFSWLDIETPAVDSALFKSAKILYLLLYCDSQLLPFI